MMIEDVVSKVVGIAGLFQKGQAVGDPEKWKTRQISATMISGLLIAVVNLAKGFGFDIPIDAETANAIGVTALVLINGVLTITTSKTVGIESKKAI